MVKKAWDAATMLPEYDEQWSRTFQYLRHDHCRSGHEHVPASCAHISHHKNNHGILAHEGYQADVFEHVCRTCKINDIITEFGIKFYYSKVPNKEPT